MRQHETAKTRLGGDTTALTGMKVRGAGLVRRERTIEDCDVGVAAESHQAVTVLGVAGVSQGLSTILNSVTHTMEVRHMGHGSRSNPCFTDGEASVADFFDVDAERWS